jgi:spore coat protein A
MEEPEQIQVECSSSPATQLADHDHPNNPDLDLAIELLDPFTQSKFVNKLPDVFKNLARADCTKSGKLYTIGMFQIKRWLGLIDPDLGTLLATKLWGFGNDKCTASFPGPTFVVKPGKSIYVRWENKLLDKCGRPLLPFLPVDTTIHWADPKDWPFSGMPTVVHLHGGKTEPESDGYPEAWFTPDFKQVGPDWVKKTYHYGNKQEPYTTFYHDHALGVTRLNVYAGLAGFYLLVDRELEKKIGLPAPEYDVPMLIDDRSFLRNGNLYYSPFADGPPVPPINPPFPSVRTHFSGEFILVNGMTWPVLEVEPRKYRFRWLIASNTRTYNLALSNGQSFYVIASDQGFLNFPVKVTSVLMQPAERFEVIIDFRGREGQKIILTNGSNDPYPNGKPVTENTNKVMLFSVSKPLNKLIPDKPLPKYLRECLGPIERILPKKFCVRQLVLGIGEDEYGRAEPLLGTVKDGLLKWHDPITEKPRAGTYEVWEFYNETNGAHPIHLHLVHFLILDQATFTAKVAPNGSLTDIVVGTPTPPARVEQGRKDMVRVDSNLVVRILVFFPNAGLYVWHCHISEHEDHDMMRPMLILDKNGNEPPSKDHPTHPMDPMKGEKKQKSSKHKPKSGKTSKHHVKSKERH